MRQFVRGAMQTMAALAGSAQRAIAWVSAAAPLPGSRVLGLRAIWDDCSVRPLTAKCQGILEALNLGAAGNLGLTQPLHGALLRVTPDGSHLGAIVRPAGQPFTSINATLHEGWLYIAEANSMVWGLRTKVPAAPAQAG